MFTGIDKNFLGNQTDYLSTGHPETSGLCGTADFFECLVKGNGVNISDVHRYLCDAVFVNEPSDGLASLQCPGYPYRVSVLVLQRLPGEGTSLSCNTAFLPDVKRDSHCSSSRSGIEVEIYGNQEVPCSDIARSGSGHGLIVFVRTEVGLPLRILYLFGEGLIFSASADGEVLSFRFESAGFIAIAWDAQLFIHAFGKVSSEDGAFFQSYAGYRDEREYVGGSASGVCSMMKPHIYETGRGCRSLECGFTYCFRAPHESHDSAVCRLTGVHVEDFYPFAFKGG